MLLLTIRMAAWKDLFRPLLALNFILYVVIVGFASWCLARFIDGDNGTELGGNSATFYFVVFSILAGVVGVASKLAGGNHVRASKNHSLGTATSTAIVAWAITALAFGLACKEIDIGGYRGWRLKTLEALIIIVTFTQLLYIMILHA